jgi:group II intron reverse transcriptase/maturase
MKHNQETFTRLYRYLLREDLYYQAYKNLYANNGAATKGINDDTADGFSEETIKEIIITLRNGTYQPKPVRRTYIKKPNGKQRPLGIPTFTDKLVQEVLRMVLEAMYEPLFLDCSHGFRPKRSCHTALKSIKYEFDGARWFVEGDIRGCFDNIDHHKLIELISKKVKDARIIQLVYKFLKAGYLEDWQYHKTYSGTPQGGIISPLLSNIYLHELDKFVIQTLKPQFDRPSTQKRTPEYQKLLDKRNAIKQRKKRSKGAKHRQCIDELKRTRAILLKIPSKSQTDKKLKFCRYADDVRPEGLTVDTVCSWIYGSLSVAG